MLSEIQNMDIATSSTPRRYHFLGKLGSGGMADVFLGIQRGEQDVTHLTAIKRLHGKTVGASDINPLQMFVEEARVVAALNHPHIVKVFDLLPHQDSVLIAMEYVDGETMQTVISECVKQHRRIPLPIICRWVADAAAALHYAHNVTSFQGEPLQLIHRDIDMRNIMVDQNGFLKIIDFGVAQTISKHALGDGDQVFVGKISYTAPEVFTAPDSVDHRSDLYALGLVLHALVTQRKPYPSKSATSTGELVKKVVHEPLIRVRSLDPTLPDLLDSLIIQATHKDPAKRFQSGDAFAEAVEAFAREHEGIATPQEVRRWYREHFAHRIEMREKFLQEAVQRAKQLVENHRFKDEDPERDSMTPSLVFTLDASAARSEPPRVPTMETMDEANDEAATMVLRFPKLQRFRHHRGIVAAAASISALLVVGALLWITSPSRSDNDAAAVSPPLETPTAPARQAAPATSAAPAPIAPAVPPQPLAAESACATTVPAAPPAPSLSTASPGPRAAETAVEETVPQKSESAWTQLRPHRKTRKKKKDELVDESAGLSAVAESAAPSASRASSGLHVLTSYDGAQPSQNKLATVEAKREPTRRSNVRILESYE